MRIPFVCLLGTAALAQADIRVFVQEQHGLALIRYECTAGEVVRAFALDAVVDRGSIVGVSRFSRGESRVGSRGYGIFPGSFREQLGASPTSEIDWASSDYVPVAVSSDHPEDTQPGLGSRGVTLELGALWDPSVPEAAPESAGTLCALHLSEAGQVSLVANASRGGVVLASSAGSPRLDFSGAYVDPAVLIRGAGWSDGKLAIAFQGGELEYARSLEGPWLPTGNSSGLFQDSSMSEPARFYRVRRP